MAGIQLGGLASGLDTNTLISQLMAIERQPRARLERQQAAVQARQDALKDIASKLKSLKLAATDLQSVALWTGKQSVTSADPTKIAARATGQITAGTYDVNVTRQANSASRSYSYASRNANTTLTLTDNAGTNFSVAVPPNATVDQIAALVNGNSALPATARNVNGSLVLDARATGAPGNFTVTGQGLTQTAATAGVNAAFTVNGTAYSSSTNTGAASVPGLELDLNALTGGTPVRVTVGAPVVDKDAVKAKLKAFVESYNAVADTIRAKLNDKKDPKAATLTDAKRGVLFNDSGLNRVLSELRIGLMEPVSVGNSAAVDELAEIGISTGAASAVTADKNNGRLVFDEAKFDAVWEGDPASVERLLRGSGSLAGYAGRLDKILKPLTDAGGIFDGRIAASNGQLDRLKDSMANMDDRLGRKELFLRRQFTALETALQKMNSQGAELAAKLGSTKDS